MKSVFFALIVCSLFGFGTAKAADLQAYNLKACGLWTWHGGDGNPGWLCGTTPTTATVPDAYSVKQVISELEQKIQALEKRVAELEKKNP